MKIQKMGKKNKLTLNQSSRSLNLPTHSSYSKNIQMNTLIFFSVLLIFGVALFYLYRASIPKTYRFQQGAISDTDIFLGRPIINESLTEIKAKETADSVKKIFKIDKDISNANLKSIKNYLDIYLKARQDLYENFKEDELKNGKSSNSTTQLDSYPNLATELKDALWRPSSFLVDVMADNFLVQTEHLKKDLLNLKEAKFLLELSPSISALYIEEINREANLYNQQLLDREKIEKNIESFLKNKEDGNFLYRDMYQNIANILQKLIKSNAVYDENATNIAKENAYKSVLSNPILVEKGTRIISRGDLVNEEKLRLLRTAGLLDEGGIDFFILAGSILLLLFSFILGYKEYEVQKIKSFVPNNRRVYALISTLILIFIGSYYISFISPFITPVFFLPILLTAYFSMKESLLYSVLMCFILFPLTGFSVHFLFCTVLSCVVIAYATTKEFRRDRYARLIALSAFMPAFTSLILDLFFKASLQSMLEHILLLASSGILSAIVAIGSMPIYELYMDALSPLRLIELSNPSQPILRRLYNEAIGTYHHSLMVAALAEVGAEAIDANSMLVRVGALYHDIGKLQSPLLFTENQEDENPHDKMSPYDSAKIILGHVEQGLLLAERMHLPKPLLPFISEHHGTTILQHFYQKAQEEYESLGLMPPDIKDFTYKGPIPQTRESAVLMLADSVEAAMKSAGIKEIEEAETFIRKIIRAKIEHRQLEESNLTFNEVEAIIQAFLNVYAGQFHERVKYNINENQSSSTK